MGRCVERRKAGGGAALAPKRLPDGQNFPLVVAFGLDFEAVRLVRSLRITATWGFDEAAPERHAGVRNEREEMSKRPSIRRHAATAGRRTSGSLGRCVQRSHRCGLGATRRIAAEGPGRAHRGKLHNSGVPMQVKRGYDASGPLRAVQRDRQGDCSISRKRCTQLKPLSVRRAFFTPADGACRDKALGSLVVCTHSNRRKECV